MKKEENKYNGWINIKKSFKYVKKQKKEFIFFLLGNIILTIIGGISPLLSAKQLIYITDGLLHKLLLISITILIIELSRNLAQCFSKINANIFSREILKHIQMDMAKEILNIQTSDLDKKSSGVIIDRLTRDTSRIADIFLDLSFSFTDLITNIGILFAIFIINKLLFIYYVIAIITIFIVETIRVREFSENDKKFRKISEQTTGLSGELVRGVRDLKVLNAGDSFLNRIYDKVTLLNQERYKMNTSNRLYSLLSGSVRDLFDFILIIIFIVMIKNDMLGIEEAVIVYMYRSRVFNLLSLLSNLMEWFKDFNLSAGRVFDIIDSDVFKKESFGNTHIDKVQGDFEFKDVHFSYDDKNEVLKGLSFKVKHNQTVSFVGKSGAGKSTIFSLLAKLYDIDSGAIYIDGINVNELDRDTVRGNISIITQSPYIFNMTIRENLTVVKEGLTEEEMIEACKLACLHDFVMSLPDGYDTLVGEGGLTLSGGQRQRLAIARALVQKTEIILFDEATSALDNETQKSIQDAINNMKNEYTILIIAHRLSTVINSDKIFLIDDGKIIDSGSHENLLKNNKEYKELYNLELKKNNN